MATQDDYIRTALRVPPGLHAQIHDAAKANNRTFNAEIVARLQQTFDSAPIDRHQLDALDGELAMQRALARDFRLVADFADGFRTTASVALIAALAELPEDVRRRIFHDAMTTEVAEWLANQDRRGAVFSLLKLVDGSTPALVEHLRNFASHLEDIDLVRREVVAIARGKPLPTGVWSYLRENTAPTPSKQPKK